MELSKRSAFPLSGLVANSFGKGRTVLVGHAAHVLPPIGAQGLNLGLRDAAMIADIACRAHMLGADPGGPDVIAKYDELRRGDILSRDFHGRFPQPFLDTWLVPPSTSHQSHWCPIAETHPAAPQGRHASRHSASKQSAAIDAITLTQLWFSGYLIDIGFHIGNVEPICSRSQ